MKRKTKNLRPDALSSREETLRVLALGGAGGHFGFGRYPEGIFASVRYMVILRAKPANISYDFPLRDRPVVITVEA